MSIKNVIGVVLLASASIAQATIFTVSSNADDGSANTLRWAILQNNAAPGGNTIQIVPNASRFVIRLNSLLPSIVGPAVVTATAPGVVIDGGNFIDGNNQSSCPGTTGGFGPNVRSVFGPGLAVVDSGNVEISNLEITNVCIGILLLRSHDNHVHHNSIHNVSGAAGIAVTGDDGIGAGGSTVGLSTRNLIEYNTLYETGDGMECTRGTTFTTYQYNTGFEFRDRPNVPYSQGIECAGTLNDNNVIQFNSLKGYSDGLQMNSASNLTIVGNTIAGTTYGITTAGANVLIKGNLITANRMGIGPSGATNRITITQNRIYGNGKPLLSAPGSAGGTTNPASPALLGIDFGVNGVTSNDAASSCTDGLPDCTAPQNFPVLLSSSSWTSGGTIVLNGTLASRPNATFAIELFGSHGLNTAGFGEGEIYLGSTSVTTDATGNVSFSFALAADLLGTGTTNAFFTATATNAIGQTSEFSAPLQLSASGPLTFDPALCRPQAAAPYNQTVGLAGSNMMVTSADVNASAAGCKVLARGGTAIDAAIAVQAVLAVAEPFASGLAGGSVVTYYDAALRKVRTFDGLASTPSTIGVATTVYQAAVPDDLNCKAGLTLGASLSAQQGNTNISGRAAGVPGTVKVLDLVHQQYGALAWNQLWDDAIALANNGFPMTRYMYSTLYSDGTQFDEDTGLPLNAGGIPAWFNSAGTAWGAVRCKYQDIHARYCDLSDSASQKPLAVGTLIRNPQLAATLTSVRDGGAAAFYDPNGPIVAAILKRFRDDKLKADGTNNCFSTVPATTSYANGTANPVPARIPSLMAAADFANYKAVERKPLVGTAFGTSIYTQPTPSFGGVAILYTLGLLERHAVQQQAFNSLEFVHLATEASRLANADRRNIVGDPAYSNVNDRVKVLLSSSYLDARSALIGSTGIGTVPQGTTAMGIPPFVPTNPNGYDPMSKVDAAAKVARAKSQPAMKWARSAPHHEEDWDTTSNIAIIDGYGNALSMTTTINTHWGAHIEAAGMLLNDALSNFSAGAVGSDVNGYDANKRPRSSISPSIALDASGKLRLIWGSAGGGPIPDYIVKTFLGNVVYGMDIQPAINADNWSGQDVSGTNPIAELESGKPIAGLVNQLIGTYHYPAGIVSAEGLTSGLSGIAVQWGNNGAPTYRGGADNRRNGGANGY